MERIKAAISKAKQSRTGEAAPRPRGPVAPDPAKQATPPGWAAMENIDIDPAFLEKNRIVTYSKEDSAHVPFDILRTKILKLLERNNWKSVAITSPTMACGKTLISTNLGFSFARQKSSRTVLADVDMKRPQIRKVIGSSSKTSMGDFLSGRLTPEKYFTCFDSTLALGTTYQSFRHSAELIQSRTAKEALREMHRVLEPDVVIYDLPPMLASDDAISFMAHVDCALLIAASGISTIREIDECERQLSELTHVAGVVLNKYDLKSESYYEYDYAS